MKVKLSSLYVVVNVSHPCEYACGDGQFDVMPGENPHTFTPLRDAARCQALLVLEHGHTIDTVPVYRLAAVPDEEVRPLFEEALAELEKEQEEMFDDD